ncbi:hypothetical protein [Micromonospora rubida]
MTDQTGALGSNGYGAHINRGGAAVLETVLTFLFVLVLAALVAPLVVRRDPRYRAEPEEPTGSAPGEARPANP